MISAATWLAIAAIVVPSITTLIAARLSVYWSVKANLPSAAPAANQPKQRTERAVSEPQSRWKKSVAALIGTGVPLALLIAAMSRPVVDRWSVLTIAVCVGWIAIQISISVSVYITHRIWFATVD
jgi:hypothetical protein